MRRRNRHPAKKRSVAAFTVRLTLESRSNGRDIVACLEVKVPVFYEPTDPDSYFLEAPQPIKYLRQEFYCEGNTADSCRWFLAPGVTANIKVYRTIPDPERGLSYNFPNNWNHTGSTMSAVGNFRDFISTYQRPPVYMVAPEYVGSFPYVVNKWLQAQIERPKRVSVSSGSTDRINGDYERADLEFYGANLGSSVYDGTSTVADNDGQFEWNFMIMFQMIQAMELGRRVPLSLLLSRDVTESGVIYTDHPGDSVIKLARVTLTAPVPEGAHYSGSASDARPFWGEITFGHV